MKTFEKQAAQGDLWLMRVEALPSDAQEVKSTGHVLVVAHSETGHHHAFQGAGAKLFTTPDPLTSFAVLSEPTELRHHKAGPDAHESLMCPAGTFRIRRAREKTPEGYRAVVD